jgi:hypothetical protein
MSMAENGDGPHRTASEVPVGRPFSAGFDARRNAGGRPRGLASLVRQAVGDGEDLVRFYRAVFDGDAKAIGERFAGLAGLSAPNKTSAQVGEKAGWFASHGIESKKRLGRHRFLRRR